MGLIVYERNTQYPITHVYQYNGNPSTTGQKLFFTVKKTQYDSDTTDSDAIVKKTLTIPSNGITPFSVLAGDVEDTVPPGKYYYDLKVLDSVLGMIEADSGIFKLTAHPTNRSS